MRSASFGNARFEDFVYRSAFGRQLLRFRDLRGGHLAGNKVAIANRIVTDRRS